MYVIRYKATFECPVGHRFEAEATPGKNDASTRCPACLEAWLALNVLNGRQISSAVIDPDGNAPSWS